MAGLVNLNEVADWVTSNIPNSDAVWRFNGGWPYMEIRFPDETDLTAFIMRWQGDH